MIIITIIVIILKASEFAGKAGYKLLGVPALFVAMKYIKIK